MRLLITDAEVDGRITSVFIDDGLIRDMGPHLRRQGGLQCRRETLH